MEINDILSKLGLDLSNPEVKRGAIEAIDAILTSRSPITGGDLGGSTSEGGGEQEVELDPDLLQPSVKQAPSGTDDDIEIEDEENILDQIKHKDSEDPIENTNSNGNDSESEESDSSKNSDNSEDNESSDTSEDNKQQNKTDGSETKNSKSDKDDSELENSAEDEENISKSKTAEDGEDGEDGADEEDREDEEDGDSGLLDDDNSDLNGSDGTDGDSENFEDDEEDFDEEDFDDSDSDDSDSEGIDFDDEDGYDGGDVDFEDEDEEEPEEDEDYSEDDETDDDEEFDFDEDDFVDDELENSLEDEEIKTKNDARKIKRERTIAAAKKALEDAQARRVSPALIKELEKSIEALEALTEAVAKSIKDISDEEFNLLVNRVFDAIEACGNSGMTYKSEEEREAQVKEIKDDISSEQTQLELSSEDAARIRAETQAIKARDKEAAKYAGIGKGSFKGFQDFLTSIYRAIALQVTQIETKDNSWSALSRRNVGANVLRQGQKINELPNKKIPIIDFYFDCSGSWGPDDIEIGKKAVAALADMEKDGKIKINVYYFSDEVSQNYDEVADGGTSAWNEIVKNIIATKANNVVIMTDWDMENWWTGSRSGTKAMTYTVPGYVWYLWKNGENAPRLPRDLKGRSGVQQFSFSANDL